MNRPKVVLDTNVYISGLVFGGIPAQILAAAVAGAFSLCVSQSIREEVVSTLEEKFYWSPDRIDSGCQPLWDVAELVEVRTRLNIVVADPDDDRILECAVDGAADIIVSGDDHLLRLNNQTMQSAISHIRILQPREFADEHIAQI
jgi:uncharacterized protein